MSHNGCREVLNASQETHRQAQSILEPITESLDDVAVEMMLLEKGDAVAALVDESVNHDLTLISPGATREGVFQKFVFGTIPETVAERAPTTVIMNEQTPP